MTHVIDALVLDGLRQPSFGLGTGELLDASDYHCTSDPFVLARYVDAIATDVLRAFDTNGTTLCPDLRDIDLLSR
jgi:hypothetical protein